MNLAVSQSTLGKVNTPVWTTLPMCSHQVMQGSEIKGNVSQGSQCKAHLLLKGTGDYPYHTTQAGHWLVRAYPKVFSAHMCTRAHTHTHPRMQFHLSPLGKNCLDPSMCQLHYPDSLRCGWPWQHLHHFTHGLQIWPLVFHIQCSRPKIKERERDTVGASRGMSLINTHQDPFTRAAGKLPSPRLHALAWNHH